MVFLLKDLKPALLFIVFLIFGIPAVGQDFIPAEKGVMDLSGYQYHKNLPVRLNGEWMFKWSRFDNKIEGPESTSYIQVPGSWGKFTKASVFSGNLGYGTYALRVLLPSKGQKWALLLPPINSAYRLYINDSLICSAGIPKKNVNMVPAVKPQSVQFIAPDKEIRLSIQVSNYHFTAGGIWSSLMLGSPDGIVKEQGEQWFLSAFLIGSLLMMGLYHFSLFFLWKRDKGPLCFGLICVFIALRESFGGPAFFYQLFPDFGYEASLKLLYACFPICLIAFILFFETLYPAYSKLVKRVGLLISILYIALIVGSKNTFYGAYLPIISLMFSLQVIHLLYLTQKHRLKSRLENTLVLIGVITLILCFVNDVLFETGSINSYFLLPFGFFVFTLCQSLLLAIRFSNAFRSSEQLGLALQKAEQLKSVEEMKNRFFANVTHELRTPLSLIISPVEQLLQKRQGDELLKKALGTVQRNASSLLQLINQLLDLTKLESGNMKKINYKGEINLFIAQIIDTFSSYAEERKVKVVFNKTANEDLWIFDAEKLEKIIYNLISNAIKFSPPDTEINIAAKMEEEMLRLDVHDQGMGIPEDMLDAVFERFVQADNGAHVYSGTGIGLSLVKELTEFLGGTIRLESEQGKGSSFTLSIPLTKDLLSVDGIEAAEIESFPPASIPVLSLFNPTSVKERKERKHPETILLVEDHPELMDFIGTMLSDHYQVLSAANGAEAWEICQREMPDLVISDVMMPLMGGFELCELIKSSTETDHIGVILLTARSAAESKIEGLSCGANDYLTKPFHFQELMLRIQNFLTYQQTLRNNHQKELISLEPAEEGTKTHPFLMKLYLQIENNLDNSEFTIDHLASELAVSSRTLNRKLSSLIGVSANEVIKNFRLKRAAELLAAGRNISETAYEVGFESPSYFGQCFKNVYSITPSEFQQSRKIS